MKPLAAVAVVTVLAAALAAAAAASSNPLSSAPASKAAEAKTFEVDPVHTALIFKVRYAGQHSFFGRFNELSGTFTAAEDGDPDSLRFDLTVNAESVDSGNSRRDGHLRSPDFFSAKQYPEMTFKSTKVERKGKNGYAVTGNLTLRGITKTVSAEVEYGGQGPDRRGGIRAGFDGSFTIDRTDFEVGNKFGEEMLGHEVTIMLGLSGVHRD